MYKRFGKSVEFKKYLHGICDAGSRLLFKFRSGTHGLNEELGRHKPTFCIYIIYMYHEIYRISFQDYTLSMCLCIVIDVYVSC